MNPIMIVVLGSKGPYAGSDDLPSVVIRFGKRVILLDAGEGVQHRLLNAGLSVAKVSLILITHLHGDHVLGLIPLLQSRSLSNVEKELTIVGPTGIREYLLTNFKLLRFVPCYSIRIYELQNNFGDLTIDNIHIKYLRVNHDVDTYGYMLGFHEKNKCVNICYVTDTRPINLSKYFGKCNLLIHDATFLSYDKDLANNYGHSTALDAAKAAKEVNAELLLLFHTSPRYDNEALFEEEARRIFKYSYVAKKYMKLIIKP